MGATEKQQLCIDSLESPLAIEAGAGSGKTFTLTERIVHAIESGHVGGIDEILAITFTKKAAAELQARVKGLLRSRSGKNQALMEEALRADDAWISTIHGMCSRILKAHAIELGIDPSFEIAEEDVLNTLRDEAIEEVLRDALSNEDDTPELDALFESFDPRPKGEYGSDTVENMLKDLVDKASVKPQGFDAFVLPPKPRSASSIASDFFRVAASYTASLEDLGLESSTRWGDLLAAMRDNLAIIEPLTQEPELSFAQLWNALSQMTLPRWDFGGAFKKEVSIPATDRLMELANEARFAFGWKLLATLLDLARKVKELFEKKKRREGYMSNDDLLVMCSRAIDEHPDIADYYRNKFKLVMIDEFQDTDQVQLDMIRKLSGVDAEHLCTVGDAQQSIYRFRNADVAVYKRHLETVREMPEGEVVKLDQNFRSHEQVLSFVDAVFSQDSAFGDDFMSLSAGRDESEVAPAHPDGIPRIQIQLETIDDDKKAVRAASAQHIADAFASFNAAGYEPGDMVVLLRSMTHADVYARALRERGLPCVIAGGSVFTKTDEFATIKALACLAANTHNTQALFEVLQSKIFELTADDLLLLGSRLGGDGLPAARKLEGGVQALLADKDMLGQASASLKHAIDVVNRFTDAAVGGKLSTAMYALLKVSGVFARRQAEGAQGFALVGNYYKGVRLVEQLEDEEALNAAGVANGLAAMSGSLKASPGALSTDDSNFVRLMTIHASKGLEFPVVAVSELKDKDRASGALFVEEVGGVSYIAINFARHLEGLTKKAKENMKSGFEESEDEDLERLIHDAASPLERASGLIEFECRAESKEAKRLAYVAFTRARESLVVSLEAARLVKNPLKLRAGIGGDIQTAVCTDGSLFPETEEGGIIMPCGKGELLFTRTDYMNANLPEWFDTDAVAASDEPFIIPEEEEPILAPSMPYRVVRSGVFSYSAISDSYHDMDAALAIADEEDEDAAAWAAINANLGDADKATDLGTAFHRLAQYAVEHRGPGGLLQMPPADRIDALASGCVLSAPGRFRLDTALKRWFGSDVAARMAGYSDLRAEVPLFITLDNDGAPIYLEGEIDLLALPFDGPAGGAAVIIDYKTGGKPEETHEQLVHKHELQAMCYSLAMMRQGYTKVEALFVRVEQEDAARPGEPQVVEFAFDASQADELERIIAETYRKSQEG